MYNERQMFSHKINRVFTCILPRKVLKAFKKYLKAYKWGYELTWYFEECETKIEQNFDW